MKRIWFATGNPGKVASLRAALEPLGVEVIQQKLDVVEVQNDDLREVAKVKALTAFGKLQRPCVVLDAGFFIPSWNGFPGTNTRPDIEKVGNEGILKLVAGGERTCEFRHCLAYMDATLPEPACFESTLSGSVSDVPRGERRPGREWSVLRLIFIPEGESRTLAEMGEDEFQKWHERRKLDHYAVQFAAWISGRR